MLDQFILLLLASDRAVRQLYQWLCNAWGNCFFRPLAISLKLVAALGIEIFRFELQVY